MALDIPEYTEDGRPLCTICHTNIGIRALQKKDGSFVPVCHSCYEELTRPVLRSEIKDIIKEAIKEYDDQKRNA